MGKFDEMCEAYSVAREKFSKFKQDSHEFASELWKKMIANFEAPAEQVTLYRIGPKGSFDVANPPITEFLTLREDGYWEFGLGITVFDSPSTFPRDTILLYLMVRRGLNGFYQVRVNGMPEVFNIEREKEETYIPFFEFVFKTVIESYHTGLERLVQEKTTNRIGFDLNEITSAAIKKEP